MGTTPPAAKKTLLQHNHEENHLEVDGGGAAGAYMVGLAFCSFIAEAWNVIFVQQWVMQWSLDRGF